jgi:DNA-binding NtrC family response regulator
VKLLRVLQEGTFQRVGGEETTKVDVRIISATNRNLTEEVAAGRFREDLFYRLCVVPIYLPRLCERRNDIVLLAEHLLKKSLSEAGREDVVISPEALDMMIDYDWPGNVRELENALRYALIKCRDNVLLPEHFPVNVAHTDASARPVTRRRRRRKLAADAVCRALAETEGNKVAAARRLGVSRATLYRFLEEHEQVEEAAGTEVASSR